jgi:hypothetical protein
MKTEFKFIHFVEVKTIKKTIYICRNNRSGNDLGTVEYHPACRQYCYLPHFDTEYSNGYLENIATFIRGLNNNESK